ncbi:hypothetical protein Tco_1388313 [Tanacetum coccineum]
MKDNPQLQHDDLPIWLALKIKFKGLYASNTSCRTSAIHPRDQDDPHDDAYPEGEKSAKRQKRYEHGTYVFGESSFGQANKSEPRPSTSAEKVSQEHVEEIAETVDESKLRKESRREILTLPFPQKPTPVVQSYQSDPKAPAISLVNQDLLYLKKGNSGPEKIMLSLHKFPVVIFPDDDIKERTSRWNPHAKIFYIKRQKEPGKPKEKIYSNSKIVQVIKTYSELGHKHKFVTEIIARRENGSIVSINEPDYKNLNKNDIKDMYLLCINVKLGVESYQQKVNPTAPIITFPGIEKHKMFSIVYELVYALEGLKSYNNDVKHGYVTPSLSKEDAEYLQLFEEEIEERLKHRNQMRLWEML